MRIHVVRKVRDRLEARLHHKARGDTGVRSPVLVGITAGTNSSGVPDGHREDRSSDGVRLQQIALFSCWTPSFLQT